MGIRKVFCIVLSQVAIIWVCAQQNAKELADKLANPVANLISVPFQNNLDYGIGAARGARYTLNIQPVIPIRLTPKWNLITRYIVPVIDQYDVAKEGNEEFGLGDATVSAFLAPAASKGGVTWGVGPAFLLPLGTNDLLSSRKWGVGPTAIVLKQQGAWTVGALANQIWSFAGNEDREDISQLFVQPFLFHNWKSGASAGLNSEMSFNWISETTSIFLVPIVSGITKLGKQTVSIGTGPRIPIAGPSASKPSFGWRAVINFVFPQ